MESKTYCVACRKHTDNIGSRKKTMRMWSLNIMKQTC